MGSRLYISNFLMLFHWILSLILVIILNIYQQRMFKYFNLLENYFSEQLQEAYL